MALITTICKMKKKNLKNFIEVPGSDVTIVSKTPLPSPLLMESPTFQAMVLICGIAVLG